MQKSVAWYELPAWLVQPTFAYVPAGVFDGGVAVDIW